MPNLRHHVVTMVSTAALCVAGLAWPARYASAWPACAHTYVATRGLVERAEEAHVCVGLCLCVQHTCTVRTVRVHQVVRLGDHLAPAPPRVCSGGAHRRPE